MLSCKVLGWHYKKATGNQCKLGCVLEKKRERMDLKKFLNGSAGFVSA